MRATANTPLNSTITTTSDTSTMPSVVRATGPRAPVSVRSAIVTAGECTTAIAAKSRLKPTIVAVGVPWRKGT